MKKTKLAVTLTTTALLAADLARAADSATPTSVQAGEIAAMSRNEVKERLAQIEPATASDEVMGAMCYMTAFVVTPDQMEYVCPHCGEKTIHGKEVAARWTEELESCRRLVREIPKVGMFTLDESSFCRRCVPKAGTAELVLVVHFDDHSSLRVAGVGSSDLGLLRVFFLTKRTEEEERALHENIVRLRELLGEKQ